VLPKHKIAQKSYPILKPIGDWIREKPDRKENNAGIKKGQRRMGLHPMLKNHLTLRWWALHPALTPAISRHKQKGKKKDQTGASCATCPSVGTHTTMQ
jgi:hypothetical protein